MNNKILSCLFGMSLLAAAVPPEYQGVYDFTTQTGPLFLHQAEALKQSARQVQGADGQRQFRVDWTQTLGNHYEFCLEFGFANSNCRLPAFTVARFQVRTYVPANHSIRALQLRLRDADDEIFQYFGDVSNLKEGWHTIEYVVDTQKPTTACWGGGKRANKRLDFPVRFHGFAGDYSQSQKDTLANWMMIGDVKMAVELDLTPPEISLETGNPIHVAVPGKEQEIKLVAKNSVHREATGILSYTVSDYRGRLLNAGRESLKLARGGMAVVPVPPPSRFGTFYVQATWADDDPRVTKLDKELRYAYMVPAGPTPGRGKGYLFGVCSHPQRHSRETIEKEAMAAGMIGVKIMREDIDWNRMQPAEDRWNFEPFDHCVATFARQGIEVQAIYSYCAVWARAKDWKPVRPEYQGGWRPDYGHWAEFIKTFAERYRNKVWYVEVWNEPDLAGFANFPAEEYIELMKIAYRQTKAVAPEMTVLTGGFALMPPSTHSSLFDQDHMKKTLTQGRHSYDVHAFHGHGRYAGYRSQLDLMFKLRKDEQVTAPWYANETANPSTDSGEYFQAIQLFQKFLYSWARGAIGYNWYDLRNDGFDKTYGEHNFGLITKDFYPKCAYSTYNMLGTLYPEATYLGDVQLGEQLDAFAFRAKNGDMLIPNWSMNRTQQSTLVLLTGVTGEASVVDMFGNATPLGVENDALALTVGHEPCTLRLTNQRDIPVCAGQFLTIRSAEDVLQGSGNCPDFKRRQQDFLVVPGRDCQLVFDISNPTNKALDASIELTLPQGIAGKDTSASATIPALGRSQLAFALTSQPDFGKVPVAKIMAKAKLGRLWEDTLPVDVSPVVFLPSSGPQPQFILDQREQNVKLVAEMGALQHLTWAGPDDLSAQIWLDVQGDNLLLKAVVKDDRHVQPYSGFDIWKGDSIQFALDLGDRPYYEFGLARKDNGESEVFVFMAPENRRPKLSLKMSRDEASKTTTYEAVIPFAEIGLTRERARGGFLFNLLVNDNDGEGREGYMEIAPGIGAEKSARAFKVLKLKE